jgi:hypothetical protein
MKVRFRFFCIIFELIISTKLFIYIRIRIRQLMSPAQVERYGLRIRSYTTPYTTVSILYTLRIRPYFAGFHVTGLRSYMSVTVYDEIRRNTVIVYGTFTLVNDRIFLVYGSLRPCFGKLRYTLTVIFLPSHLIPPRPLPSYLSLKIS